MFLKTIYREFHQFANYDTVRLYGYVSKWLGDILYGEMMENNILPLRLIFAWFESKN